MFILEQPHLVTGWGNKIGDKINYSSIRLLISVRI